jgi:carboxymethylenebutenolidase
VCDQDQLAEMGQLAGRSGPDGLSRREFAAMGAAATALACVPIGGAAAQARLSESNVTFDAPGGRMDGFLVHPGDGKNPAIIVWPDIAGLRDAFMSMSRRLAREGYSVLILNPYYADEEAPQFDDFDDFRTQGGMDKVAPWREKLTAASVTEIAKAVVTYLDAHDSVDAARGIGVQGYCMGGPFAVWTAAAAPERVKAAASFHGGGLVGEEDTAPVKVLGQTQASYLFAIARNDDRTAPGDKDALKAAAEAAGRPAEIKVYRADHGWTVADSPAYNYDEDDASWERLLELYSTTL